VRFYFWESFSRFFAIRCARLFLNHPRSAQIKPAKKHKERPSVASTNKIPRSSLGCIDMTAAVIGFRPNRPTTISRIPIGKSLDFGIVDVGVDIRALFLFRRWRSGRRFGARHGCVCFHVAGDFPFHALDFASVQNICPAKAGLLAHSTLTILVACFAPPRVSCGWSPCFLPMSCSPNGDCGVMTRISLFS
jgi:hypothetical protein